MKKITDQDLTLLYYGEHDDPSLAATVAASEELSRRFEALSDELARLDALAPPQRGDDYGAEVWRRIAPRLDGDEAEPGRRRRAWLAFFGKPRLSLAGAFSFALVFTVAYYMGQGGFRPDPSAATPSNGHTVAPTNLDATELMANSVADHLDQLNVAFTQFALSSNLSDDTPEQATDLLVANRLYRQAAETRGDRQLAAFLAEIEPMLIELAYEAYRNSPDTRDRMQQEVRDSLLFRIRIMNQQLNKPRIST